MATSTSWLIVLTSFACQVARNAVFDSRCFVEHFSVVSTSSVCNLARYDLFNSKCSAEDFLGAGFLVLAGGFDIFLILLSFVDSEFLQQIFLYSQGSHFKLAEIYSQPCSNEHRWHSIVG